MRLGRRVTDIAARMNEKLRGPSESSTLIVPVHDAAGLVELCNEGQTAMTLTGIPPHITILYPFVPPNRLDDRLIAQLGDIFAEFRPFSFSLKEPGHFPGVTWLRPIPASGFMEMTEAVVRGFPAFPPYGGAFDSTVHHLTLTMRDRLPPSVAGVVDSMLPVAATAEEVWLMVRPSGGQWDVRDRIPLGRCHRHQRN